MPLRKADVKVEGPVIAGAHYTLVIRDVRGSVHESNPGPYETVLALAVEYNRRQLRLHKGNSPALAHVRYVEPVKKVSDTHG